MQSIRATWMRGGTSKCWVFERDRLQVQGRSVDQVLLRLFGSPDPRQVDGVGGGTSTTSKAVILSVAADGDDVADVDYTFAQVAVEEARVDWGSNCGNCSSVVGLYAVQQGWVPVEDGLTSVRVRNTNTGQLIVLQVPTPGRRLDERGLDWTPGVPFPGTRVEMWFADPAGRTTGHFQPSGRAVDQLDGPSGAVPASLVDAGAPLVLVAAAEVGLTGHESPADIDARPDVLRALDAIRRQGAVRMGLAAQPDAAERAIPKLALLAAAAPGDDADLVVRMLSMGRVHPALAITGSVGITLAARTAGTIAHALADTSDPTQLRLATPAGVVTTSSGELDGRPSVGVIRTARRLAEATLLLPSADELQLSAPGGTTTLQDARSERPEVTRDGSAA